MNLTPIIAIVPPAAAFLLFAAVLFLKYRKKRVRTTLYFMLAFLLIGMGYSVWVVRTLFYPIHPDAETVIFWVKVTYLGATFCVFLGLAALEFLRPEVIRKTRNLLLFATPMIFMEILILLSNPPVGIVAGQSDVIWPPLLSFIIFIIALFYLIIPNYVFIMFLIENPKHRLYSRVRLMEVGLIIFTVFVLMEGAKIGMESWGLFVRWFTALGALIIMYAYIKRWKRAEIK